MYVNIDAGERYPVYHLVEPDASYWDTGIHIDVPDETAREWQRIQGEYDQMQEQMQERWDRYWNKDG